MNKMVRIVGGTGNYVKMHFRQDKHIRSYRQAHAKGDDRMKNKKSNQKVEGSKIASIIVLSALTILIVLMGIVFSVYSIVYNVSFHVLNADIPGYIWGAIIAFLGIRNFLAVRKLKDRVYASDAKFSWDNFKSDKHGKSMKQERPMLTKHWMKG
jgi:hypothetical protein